jgi:hypothetical protein
MLLLVLYLAARAACEFETSNQLLEVPSLFFIIIITIGEVSLRKKQHKPFLDVSIGELGKLGVHLVNKAYIAVMDRAQMRDPSTEETCGLRYRRKVLRLASALLCSARVTVKTGF